MQTKRIASHVLYHEISPEGGANVRATLRLARGEAVPLPLDPSPAGRLSPLHPDAGQGVYPLPAPTPDEGVAARMADRPASPALAFPPVEPERKAAPWRGRKRTVNPLSAVIHIRCTPAQHAAYEAAAARAGYSIGEYFRILADAPGPRPRAARRPPVEKTDVARLLGLLGNLTSNVNQLARAANTAGFDVAGDDLARLADDVRGMRAAVMKALGYGD